MKDQPIQMFCGHSWLTSKALASSSQKHGKGVFCKEKIMEGERIAIFGGSIMHIEEMKNYTEQQQEYPMQIEQRFVLGRRSCDGEEDTDFFNHSCDPNAGFRGQIFLVAMRDINEGEEVTFADADQRYAGGR
jgi:SET domain-containing protein